MELFTLEKYLKAGPISLAYAQDPEAVQDFVRDFLDIKDWTWDGIKSIRIEKVTPDIILQEIYMGDRDKCP